MGIMEILEIVAIFLIFVILALVFVYWNMNRKAKIGLGANTKSNETRSSNVEPKEVQKVSEYTKLSVFDFMEFDAIEDNMIVQNNGARYLMVIECEGINYDLMSEVEKSSVEAGFVQFLNTLRHPIQICTQTRTINIGSSIEKYNQKLAETKSELDKKQLQYNKLIQTGTYSQAQLQKNKMELARLQNLYEYGEDIVKNIEKMSLNKNVLKKHYYIVIPYYTSELGGHITDEEEKRNMVFSELYTRAQALIRSLFACSMKCRVMNSDELAELLYVAYNRDEAEVYTIEKALSSGYLERYSTAPDVLEKKMRALDKEIERKAIEKAKETVTEVKSEKEKLIERKQASFDELVAQLAESIIKDNEKYVGKEVAKEAIKKIRTEKKGGEENEEKQKTRRTRKTSK